MNLAVSWAPINLYAEPSGLRPPCAAPAHPAHLQCAEGVALRPANMVAEEKGGFRLMDVRWRIEILGGLRAVQGDRVLTRFRTQKTGSLLAYLAYYSQRSHLRDALIELFWPDGDPSAGRNNLSRELSWLRQHLEPPSLPPGTVIAADRAGIRLNPVAVATDVDAFEAALRAAERAASPVESAQHLAEAIEAYGGELLPGFYDGWILQEREWLTDRYFQALRQLLAHMEQAGELPRALEYARQGVRADPLREEAHRDLMRLLAAAGQPAAALRQYRELERLLKQGLDAEPAAAIQALARDIKRLPDRSPQCLPSSPVLDPPKPSAHPHNLPLQLTSFIGREQQMAEVHQLLATRRLVTLVGAGGCGKTRLALQVAADLLEAYADGVWLVELAALADSALLSQTVASALGVREQPGRSLSQTLVDYLKPRSLLLVLDNCEHLLTACAHLAEGLLHGCPNLQILATSREGLGLVGEQTYRVPSLSLPDPEHLPPLERLPDFESVQLFADRAVLSQPTFVLTAANAAAVAQLCVRLGGIPLAIELAAVRVKALSVQQIAARLDDRFRLLTGGSRTAMPRQQTLRALIDWSYDLLTDPERMLLRRLSAFAGGWTLAAAEAVCVGGGIEEWDVLDLLTALVEKSLVQYEQQEEARYRLLETIRQYGRDRLLEAGESDSVRHRHLAFFLRLAERAGPELSGAKPAAWVERLEREHDNLRAALTWSQTAGRAEAGLRLAGALGWFWEMRGYWQEGAEWLVVLLTGPGAEARTAVRAKALFGAGKLAWYLGDYRTERALYEESLAVFRELGDRHGIATALGGLGSVDGSRALREESLALFRELGDRHGTASSLGGLGWEALYQGEFRTAQALYEESVAIFRDLGDRYGILTSLDGMGRVALHQGDHGTARALYEESLATARELGAISSITVSLDHLGLIAQEEGDYAAARTLYEECLVIRREVADTWGIAWTLVHLGLLARRQEDYGTARSLLEECLALRRKLGKKETIASSLFNLGLLARTEGDFATAGARHEECLALGREVGDEWIIGTALEGLADVAVAQGQAARAARLFAVAERLRETAGVRWEGHQSDYRCSVAATRAQLDEEALAAAWAAGRAMSLDEAVAYALER
jgi:predicted ATPase/DNA-binding SARP family transcriptional activator